MINDEARRIASKVVEANKNIYWSIGIISSVITASLCCGLAGIVWAVWR